MIWPYCGTLLTAACAHMINQFKNSRLHSNWRKCKIQTTNLTNLSFLWLNQNLASDCYKIYEFCRYHWKWPACHVKFHFFLCWIQTFYHLPSICVTKYVAKDNIQKSQIYQYWLESFNNNNVGNINCLKKFRFQAQCANKHKIGLSRLFKYNVARSRNFWSKPPR